jgi:AcrR family transcriptional regulator
MARETSRRAELVEAATDYVLDHGLIGLSLRPLAASVGTSDRMLLYHFDGKDDLVATVLRAANDRSVAEVRAMAPSEDVRRAVIDLWAVSRRERMDRCARVYVEAAALGLLGREPYATVVGEANQRWVAALVDHLVASGADRRRARRAVGLLDATFMGLQLDQPLASDPGHRRTVADLADAVAAIAGATPAQGRA